MWDAVWSWNTHPALWPVCRVGNMRIYLEGPRSLLLGVILKGHTSSARLHSEGGGRYVHYVAPDLEL